MELQVCVVVVVHYGSILFEAQNQNGMEQCWKYILIIHNVTEWLHVQIW